MQLSFLLLKETLFLYRWGLSFINTWPEAKNVGLSQKVAIYSKLCSILSSKARCCQPARTVSLARASPSFFKGGGLFFLTLEKNRSKYSISFKLSCCLSFFVSLRHSLTQSFRKGRITTAKSYTLPDNWRRQLLALGRKGVATAVLSQLSGRAPASVCVRVWCVHHDYTTYDVWRFKLLLHVLLNTKLLRTHKFPSNLPLPSLLPSRPIKKQVERWSRTLMLNIQYMLRSPCTTRTEQRWRTWDTWQLALTKVSSPFNVTGNSLWRKGGFLYWFPKMMGGGGDLS